MGDFSYKWPYIGPFLTKEEAKEVAEAVQGKMHRLTRGDYKGQWLVAAPVAPKSPLADAPLPGEPDEVY